MKTLFWPWRRAFLLCAAIFLGHTIVSAKEFEDNLEKTFPVQPGGQLLLKTAPGSIEVKTGSSGEVRIGVLRRVTAVSEENAREIFESHEVTFNREGNDIRVLDQMGTKRMEGGQEQSRSRIGAFISSLRRKSNGFNRSGLRVHYEVTVPREFNLDLKTFSGGILIPDLDGAVRAESSSGKVRLGEIAGSVRVNSFSGPLYLSGCAQDAELKTSSGAIEAGIILGSANIKTFSGSIKAQKVQGKFTGATSSAKIEIQDAGETHVETFSGPIQIKTIRGPVVASTSSGAIELGRVDGSAQVKTFSGPIRIDRTQGSVTAETSSGKIELKETGGDLQAKSFSGAIRVQEIKGNAQAETSGANIELETVHGTVHAKTFSGRISASLAAPPREHCRMHSSSGAIRIKLPSSSGFILDAKTTSGKIETDFPVLVERRQKGNHLEGKINGGGPVLELRSFSGSIHLGK
jgi:DUF4097 and DUF4098 domain-containing protein YvlB